jgi:hypothetical protein
MANGRPPMNRPDTDFGSGGHITHPWPKDPVDYEPKLRHGLKFVAWNMDWFADLFAEGEDCTLEFKPEDMSVRGPSPLSNPGTAPTVAHRLRLMKKAVIDLDPDIILVLEGPRQSAALQRFFERMDHGAWACHVQQSRYADVPGGVVRERQRCLGLAVRTDTSRFAADAVTAFDVEDPASGPLHAATEPFFLAHGRNGAAGWFHFETRPLYAEIRPHLGAPFRLLGLHLSSRGFFGGYDWSRWLVEAEANRMRFMALAHRVRHRFLDAYLSDPATCGVPLLVAGGLNEGPGAMVCDPRGRLCAAEVLMGSVWAPDLALGNALFDAAGAAYTSEGAFDEFWTMRFPDPISDRVRHRAWVDHVLYTRNAPDGWCAGATIPRTTLGGIAYESISDHFPVTARIDPSLVQSPAV